MQSQKLLVLDLDETLLFADEKPIDRPHDHHVAPYYIYRRPYLEPFLAHVSKLFEIAVWTSSSPAYARAVCSHIFTEQFKPTFIWASDRCTPKRNVELDSWSSAKHLRKLKRKGYDLRNVLVVDDSPEKHTQNYGNLICIEPYFGNPADEELRFLATYLEHLASVPNVRKVEKRRWRHHFSTPATFP